MKASASIANERDTSVEIVPSPLPHPTMTALHTPEKGRPKRKNQMKKLARLKKSQLPKSKPQKGKSWERSSSKWSKTWMTMSRTMSSRMSL